MDTQSRISKFFCMVLCYGNDGQVVLRYSYQLESELRISSGDTIVAQLCGECCAQVKSDRKYIKNMYRIQLVLATGLLFLSNHLLSSLYTRPVSRAYRNAPSTLDRDTAVTKRIRISLSYQMYSLALMSNRIPANELDELSSALEDGIDSEDDDEDNDNNNNNEDDDCKEIEDDYTTIFDRSKIEKARELVIDCAELDDSSPPRKDFEDMTEEELQEIYDLALGDSHAEELSRKVEAAMEADWDMQV